MKYFNKRFVIFLNKIILGFILAQLLVTLFTYYLEKNGIENFTTQDEPFYEIFMMSNALNLEEKKEIVMPPEPPKMITKTITKEEMRQDPYKLNALFLGTGGDFIIIEDGQKVEFVNLGATYKIYKLVDIKMDKAIFEVYGSKYTLNVGKSETLPRKEIVTQTITELDGKATQIQPKEMKVTRTPRYLQVAKTELKNYTGDVKKIWKEIKIKDIKENGKIKGFEIKQIVPQSIFERLGLLQGDIIVAINNKKITKYSEAFYFYRNILKYKSLKITVLRNNQQKDIEYAIAN
jgi:type II secretion system protein C